MTNETIEDDCFLGYDIPVPSFYLTPEFMAALQADRNNDAREILASSGNSSGEALEVAMS